MKNLLTVVRYWGKLLPSVVHKLACALATFPIPQLATVMICVPPLVHFMMLAIEARLRLGFLSRTQCGHQKIQGALSYTHGRGNALLVPYVPGL